MSGHLRRLLAAAVAPSMIAAAMLAIPGAAGASTGSQEISPEQAGYTATGAQFKTVDATVYLRNPTQYASEIGQYSHSVQLWSAGLVVTLGVTASTSGTDYTPYAEVFDPRSHQLLASNPNAIWCNESDQCGTTIGSIPFTETPFLSVFYDKKTGDVRFSVFPNIGNGGFTADYTAGTGVSFTQARVGTEFGGSPWDASYAHTPPAGSGQVKVAAYDNVELITYSGHFATLWSWWVHHKLLANTGQQSGSDWVAVPNDLSSGGAAFQTYFVPQSGQGPNQPVLP